MNVLISSCVRWWNAEAAYAAMAAQALLAGGHRVRILTRLGTRNEEQLRARGLPVEESLSLHPTNPLRWPGDIARLVRLQRQQDIQIVNVFHAAEMPLHLLAARAVPGLGLVRTRGSAHPVRSHRLNRMLYGRWCDGIIASAEVVRAGMMASLRIAPDRIRTVHYPVDPVPDIAPDAGESGRTTRRQALERSLEIEPNRLLIGIVGRVATEKGHRILLRALPSIVRRHPRVVLVIAAKGYPGEAEERQVIEDMIDEAGLRDHVRWTGFREDIRQVMGLLDVGVVPSLTSEMNCRVGVEFLSAGTPVVAFPTGALPEVIDHTRTGWLAVDHSAEALAEALDPVLGDEALRQRLGHAACETARERFSMDRFLTHTLAAYEDALTEAGKRRQKG